MAVRTFSPRTTLSTSFVHIRFSLSGFQAHPLGAPFVPAFQALRDTWTTVHDKSLALQEQLADARALVIVMDDRCDDFTGRFSKAVLIIVRDNRKHPLWLNYFGKKPLSLFMRPILARQLKAMESWIPSLKESPHPSLKAMAPELEALVAEAKQAVEKRDACKVALKEFNNVGERKQLIDQLNGARKEAYGRLAKLSCETPGLQSDFADRFFLSEREEDEDGEEVTGDSLRARIKALEEQLAGAKADLAALEKEEAEAQKAEAQRAEVDAELAALAAEEAALAQKRAALLARAQA